MSPTGFAKFRMSRRPCQRWAYPTGGRGEPRDGASSGGSRELHFPMPLGQAAMALSCLTISYLSLWGPGLRYSRDCTFLSVSSPTRRPIPSNVGRAGGLK